MDLNDVRNIEFLDLSGVDEAERIRVKTSLQQLDPSVQLPWIKNNIKSSANASPSRQAHYHHQLGGVRSSIPNVPLHASYGYVHQTSPIPPPSGAAIVGNVFVNREHHPPIVVPAVVPGYVSPTNVVYIASPVLPPSVQAAVPSTATIPAAAYGQQMVVQGTPQKVIPPSNASLVYPQHVPYSQHLIQPTYAPQNGVLQSEQINRIENVDTQSHRREDTIQQPNKIEVDVSIAEQKEQIILNHSANAVSENLSQTENTTEHIVQNGEKSGSSPIVGKSWASLFNKGNVNIVKRNAAEGQNEPVNNQAEKKTDKSPTECPIRHPHKSEFVDPGCYRMGEFLVSHTVDGKAISLQPRGLLNQSNYCYVNSILQALIACPPMYNLLNGLSKNVNLNEKRKPTPVIDGMCRFVREFKHLPANQRITSRRSEGKNTKKDQGNMINTDIPFEPLWIYKMLSGIQTDLIEGRQEDAEEFLGCLLNGLNDEMLELMKLIKTDGVITKPVENKEEDVDKGWQVMGPKNKGSVTRRTDFGRTPISDIFGGFLRSRIHRTGDLITENIQPFFTLQLNIEKVSTVREALEALVTKYQLEGLTSLKTNEEVEAWQQVVLDELPVILILHLKCFDFKMDGCTKIVKALEFPIDLKIDSKLLSSKTLTPKEKQYKLFSVVYHDGKEATKGHYVTDAFHVGYGCWLRYDDASVKPVQEDQVLRPQGTRVPYLLFYRRADTIRK